MNAHNLVKYYKECFSEEPEVIFDIGCHKLDDSIILAESFQSATVYSIEANPELYEYCVFINPYPDRINIFNNVISDRYDHKMKFYITPGNIGASSILVPEKFVPHTSDSSYKEINLVSFTLELFAKIMRIPKIDLVWMDVQGAELLCLRGMGTYLQNIKMIQTEVGTQAYYKDHTMYPEIDQFLTENGFEKIFFEQDWSHEANVAYVNKRI